MPTKITDNAVQLAYGPAMNAKSEPQKKNGTEIKNKDEKPPQVKVNTNNDE